MTILVIAIIVLVIGAAIMLAAAVRGRSQNRKVGTLSARTKRKDEERIQKSRVAGDQALSGRQLERQTAAAQELRKMEPSDLVVVPEADNVPVEYVPPDPEIIGVTRRQFLNRSSVALMGMSLAGFGGAVLAFLWPSFTTGFGSKINLGSIQDIQQRIRDNDGFLYVPEGRMWVTEYPVTSLEKAQVTYSAPELEGMKNGLIALYQKCPHLGCRVPGCISSQWFECPCHGSKYNRVGEKTGGPAPRGMDRFSMSLSSSGDFIVDTGTIIEGPPIGVDTTGQGAEGPNCIGEVSE